MPLLKGRKNIGNNIKELLKDNKKKGKARGANGKPRSRKQIIAIALSVAGIKQRVRNMSRKQRSQYNKMIGK